MQHRLKKNERKTQKDAASFCVLAHRIVLLNHKYVRKQDCVGITGQIGAKPNNLLFLQIVCHCYDGDVETIFFFSFPFFPLTCKSFQRLQSPTKNILHSQF